MKNKYFFRPKSTSLFSITWIFLLAAALQGGCGGGGAADDCIDKSKISGDPCLSVYEPVCGCDGKTYSNSCKAGNAGLKSWEEGECPKKGDE